MSPRTLPRALIGASLTLARLPLDVAVSALPGDGRAARLTLDRVDASTRMLLGIVLADPQLRADAQRRRAAAQREREQALRAAETAERLAEAAAQAKRERKRS